MAEHVLPIAFCFLLDGRCYLVPLAGDADVPGDAQHVQVAQQVQQVQQAQHVQVALDFVRTYLQCEGLIRVTCHLQRVLRLLDLYAQRHLHTHFITSSLCASTLGDVALLQWLLDPDAADNIRVLLSRHSSPAKAPTPTPAETPAETTPGGLDALFRLLGLACPPVASVWTEKDPEAAWVCHLQGLLAVHVPPLRILTCSNSWRHWHGHRSSRPTRPSR